MRGLTTSMRREGARTGIAPVAAVAIVAVVSLALLCPRGAEGAAAEVTRAPQAARLAVEAEPREIHVGDPVRLMLRLTADEGSDLAIQQPSGALGEVEILAWGAPRETRGPAGERTVVVEATVTAWRPGDLVVPPIAAVGPSSGEVRSEPVPITVASVGVDSSQDIRPIKDPLSLPVDWKRIALLALAALLAVVVAFLVVRRLRRRPAAAPAAPVAARPAHEVAFEALDRLASDGLVARGRVAEHYVRLTEILRRYFEARFVVPALDMTTSEILVALRKPLDRAGIRRSIDIHAEIGDLLHEADLVKFAEFSPDPADATATVERARGVVEATREDEAPPLAAAS